MGHGFGVICKECGTKFQVNDGPGMIAMPFRCDRCGKEWWRRYPQEGPLEGNPNPPTCDCGGTFTTEAPPRCPNCRSSEHEEDPDADHIMYD
jgi:predicted Zn-ribbon and HTH transcriptional regulator